VPRLKDKRYETLQFLGTSPETKKLATYLKWMCEKFLSTWAFF